MSIVDYPALLGAPNVAILDAFTAASSERDVTAKIPARPRTGVTLGKMGTRRGVTFQL